MKPSHLSTPRTLQECNFQSGYKTWNYGREEEEAGKSWLLILCILLGLLILASLSLPSLPSL